MRSILAAATASLLFACATPGPMQTIDVPPQIPADISAALQKMGRVIAPPPTEALYQALQQREPYAGVQVTRDLRYGPDARNLLDVFKPQTAQGGPRPVLVFVHGGAFMRGERRTGTSPFYDNIMLWALKQGMVGVNMTYRLAPQHTWPAAQQDLQQALRWVRENIAASGGDPQKIILMGHSAGAAHVAQYVAHPQFHAAPGGGIAGAVLLSGIFDMSTAEANPPLQAYFGKDAARYPQQSAVPGLQAAKVPLFVAYAELDPEDFHQQSRQLHAALCQSGPCAPLYKLSAHSHMSEIYAINTADTSLTAPLKAFVDGLR
jgi:acetyl esterase/lipase